MGKKATWPYISRPAMALSMRMKTKVLSAYREHNMHDANIVCASEFKNWDKMSLNGQNVAFMWPLWPKS